MNGDLTELWPPGHAPAAELGGEGGRLTVLAAHGLETPGGDPELNEIVRFVARLCEAPIALVSVAANQHLRIPARQGPPLATAPGATPLCARVMLDTEPLVVPDADKDPRFQSQPLLAGTTHVQFYAGAPLISSEGTPMGALCVMDSKPRPGGLSDIQMEGLQVVAGAVNRRLLQHHLDVAAIEAAENRERQLRRMIDSVPGIAWSADADGNFDYFNARWRQMTGTEPPKIATEWADIVHPDDFSGALDHWRNCVRRMQPYEGEWRMRTADGSYRWVLARAVPVTEDGGAARWFGTVIDIDDSHRESESRELLTKELSHRIKNIFAVISGLVAIRSRGREDIAPFAEELGRAIAALGKAHDYVRPVEGRKSDSLLGLLRDLLAPYGDAKGGRIVVKGADVRIGARAATPLALIFHELATNSAKYGALSGAGGNVSVEVTYPCDDSKTVCVMWHEKVEDGSQRHADGEEGFGSRLLRMAVEGQLGGKFRREFGDAGLEVELAVPVANITGEQSADS